LFLRRRADGQRDVICGSDGQPYGDKDRNSLNGVLKTDTFYKTAAEDVITDFSVVDGNTIVWSKQSVS
jgi:hypothetical protein